HRAGVHEPVLSGRREPRPARGGPGAVLGGPARRDHPGVDRVRRVQPLRRAEADRGLPVQRPRRRRSASFRSQAHLPRRPPLTPPAGARPTIVGTFVRIVIISREHLPIAGDRDRAGSASSWHSDAVLASWSKFRPRLRHPLAAVSVASLSVLALFLGLV